MNTLTRSDLQFLLLRLPKEVLTTLQSFPNKVCVAGGFIRSVIAREDINDVDLFTTSKDVAEVLASSLLMQYKDRPRLFKSDNAITIRPVRGLTVQIIHRWTFPHPVEAIASFDFTVARAAFWWELKGSEPAHWESACDPLFYPDLAAKRLIYCAPARIEEVGGSLLRVLKFYQRGYRIPVDSLAAVVARLASGIQITSAVKGKDGTIDEREFSKIACGLLREVDPSIDPSHAAHLPAEKVTESVDKLT